MKHASLFSGIGGFDLASEWMGWENVLHCEINPFCRKVLNHYWPNAISYHDIKSTDFTIHRGTIDVLTGGFPCQPYSTAGKRLGKEDERHLWPEMLRAIREIQPGWVVGENVRGLTNWNGGLVFDEVQADLEAQGYEVLPFLLPACGANAPHRRDRIWFVAHANRIGNGQARRLAETHGSKRTALQYEQKRSSVWHGHNANTRGSWLETANSLCRVDDGLSNRLDGITFSKWRNESIKAYGNAVVPQIPYRIFQAINEYESQK